MKTLKVELGDRSYPILIGRGLLGDKALIGRHIRVGDVLLISNTTVQPLYATPLLEALASHRVVQATLPDGEQHKTFTNVSRLMDVLVANRFNRDCTVLALGGGVVGDMAGFAAACYQRGVDFVQVPTTLLAQVDSSVGGKTGVNHPGGKNLIGAFHQPTAVFADTDTLRTLPDRELRAGLAEVIKYGLIHDAAFFDWLESSVEKLLARDAQALAHAISRSCEIKAEIVGRDEREQGERALLNFGHTFGHALEAATGFSDRLVHGEGVAIGMALAFRLSHKLGLCSGQDAERFARHLKAVGLPADIGDIPGPRPAVDELMGHMAHDKKVADGKLTFILVKGMGRAFITRDVPAEAVRDVLAA